MECPMTPRTMTFPKMKRDRVFEQVSNEIKKQIGSGTLKPGDRLPPENELARNFNVSRQTIREAMRILELSGFLSIKRGVKGGPIIENTISSQVSKALAEAIQMGPATFRW
jgi:GntR family transcriptional repressor for pyruvate dehydrogenase complex